MNVHIIRDSDVSKDLYHEVFGHLKESNGPLMFHTNENLIELNDSVVENNTLSKDDFHRKEKIPEYSIKYSLSCNASYDFPYKREEFSPEVLLTKCNNFRNNHDVGNNEFVILLTEKANTLNWFAFGDKNKNIFIHTSEWDFYLDCNRSFPIAYQVVSKILQVLLFKDITDFGAHAHIDETRGCVNDFCKNKIDVSLKMKTADVCKDCQSLIIERSFPNPIFNQITTVFEELRKKLISVERFTSRLGPGKVLFKGRIRKMILLDAGDYEVRLTPLEKTVYHLFIDNPEGIKANEIGNYRNQLSSLYRKFYNGTNIAQFENSINALSNYFDDSIQQKISRINAKLRSTVGKNIAEYYIIKKDTADEKYKITIDRALISYKVSYK